MSEEQQRLVITILITTPIVIIIKVIIIIVMIIMTFSYSKFINIIDNYIRWGGARDTGTLDMDKFR